MRHDTAPAMLAPSREQVALELARIEQSPPFRGSARHRTLLRHLVDRLLEGDLAALKESVIAVEVFGRPVDRFDPKTDTIVRVEARRLRSRLADYYRGSGQDAAIRILLPVGGYVPVIAARAPAEAAVVTRHARDLCERGEHYLRQPLSAPTLRAALERFDAALAESPDFAAAHVGRGRAWLNLATGWHEPPAPAAAQARAALQRALALEPGHAQARALDAAIVSQFERNWPAARREFLRALQAAPHNAFVLAAWGCHLRMQGEFQPAEDALLRARHLDPLYVNARAHLVSLRMAQRRYADAEAELEALRDLAGNALATLGLEGALAAAQGRPSQAVDGLERAWAAMPDVPACGVSLAGMYAWAGRRREADMLMATLHSQFDLDAISPYVRAIQTLRCGQPDEAMARLALALQRRDPLTPQIPDEPAFEALHSHPGWADLARAARRP